MQKKTDKHSISDMMNEKELLEWYLAAGVDAICGDVPGCLQQKAPLRERPTAVGETASRPAITDLAQMSLKACKNAREVCEAAATLEELRAAVEAFDGCSLKLTSNKTVFGGGNPKAKIMIVGEAPGADEDRIGEPFVGRSGHLLDKMLTAVGLDRGKVYITNVLPWRPPGNRTPTSAEVAVCLPFLRRQIELMKPEIIMVLGGSAANSLLDNEEPISRLRGKWLEYKTLKGDTAALLASFLPAYLLRNPAQKSKVWADLLRLAKKLQNN